MQLLQLQLENAKSYENATIDFTAGTNAIVGHNGAGKSTILEAIGFALFDSMAYRQSDFVREGAKTATVTVTFLSILDERPYQIVRRCGSSGQYYAYDPELGAKICEGKADVLAFLKEHMAVDNTASLELLFANAVGVPQGRLTAAFMDTPGQRKGVFDTLLQVEEYKAAADKLRAAAGALRDQTQKLELVLTEYTTRLERLPELEQSLAQRKMQIAEMARELAQTTAQLAQLGAERTQLEAIQQQIVDLQNRQNQTTQRQESAAQRMDQAAAALAAAEQAGVQVQQHLAGYEAYLETQQRYAELDQKQRQRQKIEAEQNAVEKQLTRLQAEETSLQKSLTEIEAAENKVKLLADAVARQIEIEEQLTVTQRQTMRLQEIGRTQQEQQKQLAQLTKRHDALSAQLAQADGLTTQRNEADAEANRLRTVIEATQQELARFKADADAMKEQNDALAAVETAQCPVCEQPLTPTHRAEMLARNEDRLQGLRQQYAQARQSISQYEAGEKEARAQVKQVDAQLRRLPRPEEIDALQAEVAQRMQSLAALADEQTQLAQVETELQGLQTALAELGNPRQQSAVAADMAARRPRVQKELDALIGKLAASQQTLAEIEGRLATFATVAAELARASQQLLELQPAYQAVLSNRQLADTADTHRATLAQLEQEQAALAAQQKELEAELAQRQANFDGERFKIIINDMDALRGQEVATKTQLTFSQQEQTREQAECERLSQQKEQVETIQKEKANLQRKSEVLDAMRSVLRQAGPYITRALIQQVSSSAAQFFGDMMQDYSRHLAWNEDYGITLSVDGHDRQFNQLSGGEQMSAALSVRLALLREMSNIALAFFDEPTMNLDEGRRESLARQITDIRGFRQLFVISHDDTFEQATQNIIRVERKNGLSVAHSAS